MASENMDDISNLFKNFKFRKKVFGGIDEQDVWRKLDQLQAEYQNVYDAKGVVEKAENNIEPRAVIKAKRIHLLNKAEIITFLKRLIIMAILIYVIFGVVFGITSMKNNDMMPKIGVGDLILYYRLEKNFISKDVVVFEKDGIRYTGRVAAKSGDTVEITDENLLKVNGSIVLEDNIYYSTPKYDGNVLYPITLKENQYFILCDFREGAKDSRYFGAVELDEIKGKVITVIRSNEL